MSKSKGELYAKPEEDIVMRQALGNFKTKEKRELFIKAARMRLAYLLPRAERAVAEQPFTTNFSEHIANLGEKLAEHISRPEADILEGTSEGVRAELNLVELAHQLRAIARAAREAGSAVAQSGGGRPNTPGKFIVHQLADAWRLAFGELPSASKNGRFCRLLDLLNQVPIRVVLPTAEGSIRDALSGLST